MTASDDLWRLAIAGSLGGPLATGDPGGSGTRRGRWRQPLCCPRSGLLQFGPPTVFQAAPQRS
jgi:hypothetical protein